MKLVLAMGVCLIIIVAALYLVGAFMPVKHQVSVAKNIKLERAKLWRLLTDYTNYPKWRSDISSVARLEDRDGAEVWSETDNRKQQIAYQTRDVIRGSQFKRIIVSENLAYGGAWVFQLKDAAEGSELTIREEGEVYHPLFRVLGKYVFGFDSSINRFMHDLEQEVRQS